MKQTVRKQLWTKTTCAGEQWDLLINVEFSLKSRRYVLLLHMIKKNFKSKVLDNDQSHPADVFKAVIIAEALGCDEVYICGIQRLLELFLFVDFNYRIFGVDSKCWFEENNCRFRTNLNIFPRLYLMVSARKLQIRKFLLIIFKPSCFSYTV